MSKVWDYIKAHDLQNPEDRREILADDTLRKVFGKDKCCRRRRCNAAKYSVAPRSAKAELLTCGHLARNLAEPF